MSISWLGTLPQFLVHRKELSPVYRDGSSSGGTMIFLLIQIVSVWKFQFWNEKRQHHSQLDIPKYLSSLYPPSFSPLSPSSSFPSPIYDLSHLLSLLYSFPPPLLLSLFLSVQFFLPQRWCGNPPSNLSDYCHWCSVRPCLLCHSPNHTATCYLTSFPPLTLFGLILIPVLLLTTLCIPPLSLSLDLILIDWLNKTKELIVEMKGRRIKQKVRYIQANYCEDLVGVMLKLETTSHWGRLSRLQNCSRKNRIIHCFPNPSSAEEIRLKWHWKWYGMTLSCSVWYGISSTSGSWGHLLAICLWKQAVVSARLLRTAGVN